MNRVPSLEGHTPVMVRETVAFLQCAPGKIYLDCTVGLGGHAQAILEASDPDGRVVGIDRDLMAIRLAEKSLSRFGSRATLVQGDYRQMSTTLSSLGIPEVDGILFDLGVSSLQLSDPERGFSFQVDGPLDMRMDSSQGSTAADLINTLSEKALADLLWKNGEDRWARRIAARIIRERSQGPIRSTRQLVRLIEQAVPKRGRSHRLHPATRTFQALRISVNQELEGLSSAISAAIRSLRLHGRLCMISFHSLEDRIVKRAFLREARSPFPLIQVLTKKPLRPSREEVDKNPRSRSAKLRVLEKGVN